MEYLPLIFGPHALQEFEMETFLFKCQRARTVGKIIVMLREHCSHFQGFNTLKEQLCSLWPQANYRPGRGQ